MVRVGMLVLLLLAAGCSAGDYASELSSEEPPETTGASKEVSELRVKQIFSNAPGQGPRGPKVILAPSASALSRELEAKIPDSGEGTYLVSYWGEKPTSGYSLGVESARLEGNRATVRLALEEPPSDAILTQALTYPYVVAVVRDVDSQGKEFVFVDQNGRELGWPVRQVGG
jgi:hypothetical protein